MAGTTPRLALPYPTGTDRVADGDNAIQALAEALDFEGVRVGAVAYPWATQVNAVRKPIMQTTVWDAATTSANLLVVNFPVAFTSQVMGVWVTLTGGAQVSPVIASGAVSLSSVTLYFQGAPSTAVKGMLLAIGI